MSDWLDAERHVEKAHEFYEAGRWDDAESELREALSINPHRAEWHFNLGLTLEAAGKFDEAVGAFREAHTLDPEDAQTAMALGVNCLRVDRPKEAVEWFDRARRLDSDSAEPFVHGVEAHALLGDHETAETSFYIARQFEMSPALEATAYANMAESLMDRSMYDRAIWCLREAAHLDPTRPRVHARLGAAHAATGRNERARQLYLRELRENPGCIETLLDLGRLLIDMSRPAEAAEKLHRVLEIESDHPDAHFMLAEIAAVQGREREAIATLRVVLKLDEAFPEARRRLAMLLLREGERDEARGLLKADLAAFRADPEEFTAHDLADLGGLLLDADLPVDAGAALEELARRKPDDAMAHHELSVARLRAGDAAGGLTACRRALRLDPAIAPALHNMALAHLEAGRWRRALCWVIRGLEAHPEDVPLRRLRTLVRAQQARESARSLRRTGHRLSVRMATAAGLMRRRPS